MERLTHERNNGIKTGYWSPNKKDELVSALAAYEDTGLTPEQIMELKERDTARAPEPAPLGMDGMVCPACGKKALPWDRFCGECGQRFWEDE
jgi:hypothetical protein